jgi:hypothetical protein
LASDGWGKQGQVVSGIEDFSVGAITVELESKRIPGKLFSKLSAIPNKFTKYFFLGIKIYSKVQSFPHFFWIIIFFKNELYTPALGPYAELNDKFFNSIMFLFF